MKKTKLIQIAAVLVLFILLLAGGLTQQDPALIWDEAVAKNAALTDMDMEAEVQMTMAANLDTDAMLGLNAMNVTADMTMKAADMNSEAMVCQIDMTMDMGMGNLIPPIPIQVFFADGYCYMSTTGEKFKYPTDSSSMTETLKKNTASAAMTAEQLDSLSMKKEGGNTVLTFTANSETLTDQLTQMLGLTGNTYMEISYDIREMSGDATINPDGYIVEQNIFMDFDMIMLEQPFSITADMSIRYHNPGQPVEIELPDGDEYVELDMSGYGY